MSESPEPVDVHVGLRIRSRRKELGISQTALADAVGVSFQQIQKNERGFNRVSASRLWAIGKALDVPPAYFFEGLDGSDRAGPTDHMASAMRAQMAVPQIGALADMDLKLRRAIGTVIAALTPEA